MFCKRGIGCRIKLEKKALKSSEDIFPRGAEIYGPKVARLFLKFPVRKCSNLFPGYAAVSHAFRQLLFPADEIPLANVS